ncbi:MAG: hypothetical protein A2087_12095 [Spirochaetes bacterium GWD1_61_31]|nr:MAG: hypothetical protein A2Y37_14415 [Spirochaetes bacterium GWB1_60_80]OHD42641.1 MAG: hypothetical protein A2087_12095 [Spirochaetes bacterium GWD1_61_31]OHD44540.1 MAG: hypothetical protein A2Y35_05255 [Spirochaetes bacterium GWE1_60_18]HAP43195.1 hypothetical protein [Spirochaetaceae bacterium]HAX36524.1 hypothetical protein [Spirochaetaceae bacterium]
MQRRWVTIGLMIFLACAGFAQEDGTVTSSPDTSTPPATPPPATTPVATPPAVASPAPTGRDYIPAEGLENWQLEYDLSAYAPGTYNILVRATDSAGNEALAGPFNIVVDPESDLPVTQISHPISQMRVGGDLIIVGTAVDDDAVGKVQLRLNDGEWIDATGTDYWSYLLGTADLPDGQHQISARTVDVTGVTGAPVSVVFHLDRTKPLHSMSQPAFGALVSGRFTITGSVYDANSVSQLQYSMDAGTTWRDLRLTLDSPKTTGGFSLAVDTRDMADGPSVVWFRTVDKVGSVGTSVFLYFVDNTKPEITFISPAEGQAANGEFVVTGRVYDVIGVAALEWEFGDQSGVIELQPGNPYFSQRFTAPATRGRVNVLFRATDITGNITIAALTRDIDPAANLPRLDVSLADAPYQDRLVVSGQARDGDGIASVLWRIDNGNETEIATDGAFAFELADLSSGAHRLFMRAVDSRGASSLVAERPFTWSAAAPVISLGQVSDAAGTRAFLVGIPVSTLEGRASLSGSVQARNPLSTLTYTINGGPVQNLPVARAGAAIEFTIPLPPTLPFGVLSLAIVAVDSAGRAGRLLAPLYAINYTRPRVGPWLDFGDAGRDTEGLVQLGRGESLVGRFVVPYAGEDIRSVRLEPATALLAVSNTGDLINVTWRADGITPATTVVVETVRGHRFESATLVFKTDDTPPAIRLTAPDFGTWHQADFRLAGSIEESAGLASLRYRLDEGSWQDIPLGAAFETRVGLGDLAGPILITVEAVDLAGNRTLVTSAVMVDNAAPAPLRLLPLSGAPVKGSVNFALRPGEPAFSTASIELERNGRTETLAWAPLLAFSAATDSPVRLRITDQAGNSSSLDLLEGLALDRAPVVPAAAESIRVNTAGQGVSALEATFTGRDALAALSWIAPFVSQAVDGEFPADLNERPLRVSGAASLDFSFSGVKPDTRRPEAFWGYSPQEATQALPLRTARDSGIFTGSLRLPVQPDGRRDIWIRLPDLERGDVFTRLRLEYDSTPAELNLLAPGERAPGRFALVISATDAFGIRSAEYETNRLTTPFSFTPGDSAFYAEFDLSPQLAQQAIIVRVVDGSGNLTTKTFTVRYDRAADTPQVRYLTAVADTVYGAGQSLVVYATDNAGLASVSLAVADQTQGQEGPGPLYRLNLPTLPSGRQVTGLVALDTSSLPSERLAGSIVYRQAGPKFVFSGYQQDKAAAEFLLPGGLVQILANTLVNITAQAPNGLATVEYRFNDGEWTRLALPARAAADGSWPLQVKLPASLPYERFVLAVRVADSQQLVSQQSIGLYRVAPAPAAGMVDAEGIYIKDGRLNDDGSLLLAPGDSLEALFNGRPLESVRLEPALAFASLTFEGNRLSLTTSAEGLAGATTMVVKTVEGEEFRSTRLLITSDAAPPALEIAGPPQNSWWRDQLPLELNASDFNGLATVEYSFDQGLTWLPLTLPTPAGTVPTTPGAGAAPLNIKAALPLAAADGAAVLLLRAADQAGRMAYANLAYFKDSQPPAVQVVAPRGGDLVNGSILLVLEAADSGDIASYEFSLDGESWQPLPPEAVGRRGTESLLPTARDAALPAYLAYSSFSLTIDFSSLPAGIEALAFRLVDKAGNATVYAPLAADPPFFAVDVEADKPVVEVQIPDDNEVMQANFVVSGMVFDDDGVQDLFWRVRLVPDDYAGEELPDEGEWQNVPGGNNFSVPFTLQEMSDNRHLFEAYAVDLYGVRGEIARKVFRVSREEPTGRLVTPDVNFTNRGIVHMGGVASDANGIDQVWLSFDNGNTWNRAEGAEAWEYSLDSRILQDGVHSIYLRFIDGYGITGFSAGLISVDNTAPVLALDRPFDGGDFINQFTLGGRVSDGIFVASLTVEITPVGKALEPLRIELPTTTVFSRVVDISALEPGWYNLRVSASDRASNESFVTRNIMVLSDQRAESIEFIFPAHGEELTGTFSVDGRVFSTNLPPRAVVYLNNEVLETVDVNREGFFSLSIDGATMAARLAEEGEASFRLEASRADGSKLVSEERAVVYKPDGPWLLVNQLITGDFITGRPYVSGTVGWLMPEVDRADRVALAAYQRLLAERKVTLVEFSRDNGRSFEEAAGTAEYRFRLETQEYPNGELRLLIRATFANGQTVVRKRIFMVDTLAPEVEIVRPAENGRFNHSIAIEGTAGDLNGLREVAVIVRPGDKAAYEVPAFIQGSYLDINLFGATRIQAGIGLTFFEDKVKLQVQIGQGFWVNPTWENPLGMLLPDTVPGQISRFRGWVLGAKLLASVAYIPFSYYFGPDWDFFSMSFAIGASFTYFSQQSDVTLIFNPLNGQFMVLSGVVMQWEVAKFSFDWAFFKSFAFYVEGGLIFIPSEASTTLEEFIAPTLAFGLRIGLF